MKISSILSIFRSLNHRQKLVGGIVLAAFALLVVAGVLMLKEREPGVSYDRYVSNQGGFEVEVPNGNMVSSQAVYVLKERKLTRHTHEAIAGTLHYTVSHFDLPAGFITPPERIGMVNTLASEYLIPFNGVIAKSEPVKPGGYEGLRVKAEGIEGEKTIVATVMVVTVSNRVFVVGVKGNLNDLNRRKTDRFLESFGFVF